jgi:rubrerythrin
MKALIKALQKAHAGELAAFYAYEGHYNATKDRQEQTEILNIQMDEGKHILTIRKFLNILGADTSPLRDLLFICIGRVAGALCHISGWRNSAYGARMLETVGVNGYRELALLAAEEGRTLMALKLQTMAKQEQEHERYFTQKLSKAS